MIMRLFRSRRQKPPATHAPAGSRIYAIGDIHGRVDLLAEMHDMILADSVAVRDRRLVVVYLGDYIDRGLDSRQVIELLIETPLGGFESVHLLGNHESWLLDFLSDSRIGGAWLFNGGNATLYSYGVREGAGDSFGALIAEVENTKEPTTAADLLDRSGEIGGIREGYFADIIAVRGNPLEEIAVLEDVVSGYAVAYNMVDGRADRFWKAVIVERGGDGLLFIYDVVVTNPV